MKKKSNDLSPYEKATFKYYMWLSIASYVLLTAPFTPLGDVPGSAVLWSADVLLLLLSSLIMCIVLPINGLKLVWDHSPVFGVRWVTTLGLGLWSIVNLILLYGYFTFLILAFLQGVMIGRQ